MLEALIIIGFILFVVLPMLLAVYSAGVRGIKQYVKNFSLRDEWEALKSVKFYKEN